MEPHRVKTKKIETHKIKILDMTVSHTLIEENELRPQMSGRGPCTLFVIV